MDTAAPVQGLSTITADDLDKELLAQLHNATLKASDVCFELKKLCATVLVPITALVGVFSAKRLDMSVFIAAITVIASFWLADSVGYYYQRRLRVAMSKIWIRRAARCAEPWDFRPMAAPRPWKAIFNGSMTFYYILVAVTVVAMCLYLTGVIESGAIDGTPSP